MKKVYQSKIGLELVIPLVLVFGTVSFLVVNEKLGWLAMLILLPVIIFIVHLFMTTNYTIEGENLTIQCGFLFNQTIDIKTIKEISETSKPISSPATSLDRLEIKFGQYDTVLISPKLKKEFILAITSINSKVVVKLKKKSFV